MSAWYWQQLHFTHHVLIVIGQEQSFWWQRYGARRGQDLTLHCHWHLSNAGCIHSASCGCAPPLSILMCKVLFSGKSEITKKMTPYEVYRRFYVGIRLCTPKKNHWLLPEGQKPYPYLLASHCLMPSPWQPAASINYWQNVSIFFGPIFLLRQAQVQLSYYVKMFLLKVAVMLG